YQALSASLEEPPARYDTALEAVREAPEGAGVLLLADGYPDQPLPVPAEVFEIAADKDLKLYLEYPADGVAGLSVGTPAVNGVRRLVVHPREKGGIPGLDGYAILDAHEAWYVPVTSTVSSDHQILTLARVA